MARSSKVFISYAHGDRAYQNRVRALADRLELLGLETIFDQYETNPAQGWTKWMVDGIRKSDFVLCLCTPAYHERVNEDQESGTGLGVQWEGTSLYNLLQSEPAQRNKVQVVQFDTSDATAIPLPIRGNNRFRIAQSDLADEKFRELYRVLTGQGVLRPVRGSVVDLDAETESGEPELQILPPRERPGADVPTGLRLEMKPDPSLETVIEDEGRKRRTKALRSGGPGGILQRLSRQSLQKAQEAFDDGRHAVARSLADEALRRDGSLEMAYFIKVASSYNLERWKEAAEASQAYEEHGGEDIVPVRLLGLLARYRLHRDESDLERAKDLARAHPELTGVQRVVGDTIDATGEPEEARAWFRAALVQDDSAELLSSLAIVEWRDGKLAESTRLLEAATAEKPTRPHAWANLGVAYAEARRFGLALQSLERAQSLRPNAEFALYALAEVYALMGDAEASVELLTELVMSKSHLLGRVATERTFDPIRDTPEFQAFLATIPPEPI